MCCVFRAGLMAGAMRGTLAYSVKHWPGSAARAPAARKA